MLNNMYNDFLQQQDNSNYNNNVVVVEGSAMKLARAKDVLSIRVVESISKYNNKPVMQAVINLQGGYTLWGKLDHFTLKWIAEANINPNKMLVSKADVMVYLHEDLNKELGNKNHQWVMIRLRKDAAFSKNADLGEWGGKQPTCQAGRNG